MKLAKLIAVSDKLRKINSKFVKITGYKNGWDRKGIATAICRSYSPREYSNGRVVPAKDLNKYTTSIKFLDKQLNVKVSCSCPDFMYRWEYANHRIGVSDIIYSNGEPARETNPLNRPGGCKHILALAQFVKDRHGL